MVAKIKGNGENLGLIPQDWSKHLQSCRMGNAGGVPELLFSLKNPILGGNNVQVSRERAAMGAELDPWFWVVLEPLVDFFGWQIPGKVLGDCPWWRWEQLPQSGSRFPLQPHPKGSPQSHPIPGDPRVPP